MQTYPYYNVNHIEGGIMVKLFKNKHFSTQDEALEAFNKWRNNHKLNGQYVILQYTSYYTSRICIIFEDNKITWLD